MCAGNRKRSFAEGVLKMQCPNCRNAFAFEHKSVFPLNKCLKLVDHCPNCGQRMVSETNNGPGINYALSVIIFLLNLAWYWPIFGLHYDDYSVEIYMSVSAVIVLLLQPWTMRYSRILYLYFFVPYQSNRHLKKT